MKKIISIIFAFAMVLSSAGMTAAAEGGRFVDVPDDAWYAQYVSECAEKGLMIGNPDNEFEPEAPITRAQFVQTLYTYYQKNIRGTDIEIRSAKLGGWVATTTEINGTYPFTLEETVKVNIPASSEVARELTLQATREELLSGKYPASMSAYHVTQDVNKVISFESSECLTVIPDSPAERCVIRMTGGSCCSSRFSGFAERVTVSTDIPKVEAKTRDGADFEIILCDLDSRTQVLVWGKSSGDLSAELSGYDLTVRGAKGIYNVYVYEWAWNVTSGVLKSFSCNASTEKLNVLPFHDVRDEAYYTEALKWASSHKITAGVDKVSFVPNAPITREQMASMLVRFMMCYDLYLIYINKNVDHVSSDSFADDAEISDYAVDPVKLIGLLGIMVGDENGRFNPKAYTKRCEAAVLLLRLDGIVNDQV